MSENIIAVLKCYLAFGCSSQALTPDSEQYCGEQVREYGFWKILLPCSGKHM